MAPAWAFYFFLKQDSRPFFGARVVKVRRWRKEEKKVLQQLAKSGGDSLFLLTCQRVQTDFLGCADSCLADRSCKKLCTKLLRPRFVLSPHGDAAEASGGGSARLRGRGAPVVNLALATAGTPAGYLRECLTHRSRPAQEPRKALLTGRGLAQASRGPAQAWARHRAAALAPELPFGLPSGPGGVRAACRRWGHLTRMLPPLCFPFETARCRVAGGYHFLALLGLRALRSADR